MVGDEHARVTEAVKAAERHLKCKALRTSPYWSKDGYSKRMHNKEVRSRACPREAFTSCIAAHKGSSLPSINHGALSSQGMLAHMN